jgi:hypothetical protein
MTDTQYTLALSQLLSLEDNTIEDSDNTDALLVAFEEGESL